MLQSPAPPPEKEKRPQFGTRFLTNEEEVFKHNAWDQVEWGEEQESEALEKVIANSGTLPEEVLTDLYNNSADQWDKFYGVHNNRFFKDRHWLFTEFPELKLESHEQGTSVENAETSEEGPNAEFTSFHILEVGCGVGNTIFPLLENTPDKRLFVYGCDFAPTAIDIVKSHELYDTERCLGFVSDISQKELTLPIPENSLDIITMVFVLSAINPADMQHCITNLVKYIKPGGHILFRDYGRFDLAQLRFKNGRCLSDNFYARGDGTKVYFFEQQEVHDMFEKAGLVRKQNLVDRRLQVNRGRKLKMYRAWLQCKYMKPLEA